MLVMEDRYIKLQQGKTTMIVDKVGAQVVSLKIDGVEVMFQGALNPSNAQWKASAKNLFPNPGPVGNTDINDEPLEVEEYDNNGKIDKYTVYHHNGGKYRAKQHGFAQDEEFKVFGQTENTAFLSISAERNQTYTQYPYNYKYDIDLGVQEGGFTYKSHVRNIDTKPILAGMGWHPAFALHDDPSRYTIVFKNLKTDGECEIEEDVEYDIYDSIISNNKSVKFGGIKSVDVVLLYTDDNGEKIPYLSMHSEEPYIILWSKNVTEEGQNHFICIEPWNTTPRQINNLTTQDKTKDLVKKGAVIIEPGKYKTLQATVDVNPKYIKRVKVRKKAKEAKAR